MDRDLGSTLPSLISLSTVTALMFVCVGIVDVKRRLTMNICLPHCRFSAPEITASFRVPRFAACFQPLVFSAPKLLWCVGVCRHRLASKPCAGDAPPKI